MMVNPLYKMPSRLEKFLVENEKRCRHMFKSLDSSGRGKLWREEFEHALRILCAPVSDIELRKITASSNTIYYDEFLKAAKGDLLLCDGNDSSLGEKVLRVIRKKLRANLTRSEWLRLRLRVKSGDMVTRASLRQLLWKNDIFIEHEQIESVFQILNVNERGKCLLQDVLNITWDSTKPTSRETAKLNSGGTLPTIKPCVVPNEKQDQPLKQIRASSPRNARLVNMNLVKSILIREGYLTCTRRLLESVSSGNQTRKGLDKDFCTNLTGLVVELVRLTHEVVHNIAEWKEASAALEQLRASASTWESLDPEGPAKDQFTFLWKKQNYLLRMSDDTSFLRSARSLIVGSLCETSAAKKFSCLEEILPIPLNAFRASERVIYDELEKVEASNATSQSPTCGDSNTKNDYKDDESRMTELGRILRHAMAQHLLEAKSSTVKPMEVSEPKEFDVDDLVAAKVQRPMRTTRQSKHTKSGTRKVACRRNSLPKLGGVRAILRNNKALFRRKRRKRVVGRQLFHAAPSVSVGGNEPIDVSMFGKQIENVQSHLPRVSHKSSRPRPQQQVPLSRYTTSIASASCSDVATKNTPKRSLVTGSKATKNRKSKQSGDAVEVGMQLQQLSVIEHELMESSMLEDGFGGTDYSNALNDLDGSASSEDNYSGFLSPASPTSRLSYDEGMTKDSDYESRYSSDDYSEDEF